MKRLLLSAVLVAICICTSACSSEKQKEADLYSSVIKYGKVEGDIFLCGGGHFNMRIKYKGIEHEISHSHGGVHEMGRLVAGPVNSDGIGIIEEKEVLLTQSHEQLLIQRIAALPDLERELKEEYLQSIERFSIYNLIDSKKVNSIRILTSQHEPIKGATVVLRSAMRGQPILDSAPTDETGFVLIPETYHLNKYSVIVAIKDGMSTRLDTTPVAITNDTLTIEMYSDGKWKPLETGY